MVKQFDTLNILFVIRMIRKVNSQLETESRQLRHAFNDMDMLRTPERSIEALLRGLTEDRSESMDSNFVDDVMIRVLTILCNCKICILTHICTILCSNGTLPIILFVGCSLFV